MKVRTIVMLVAALAVLAVGACVDGDPLAPGACTAADTIDMSGPWTVTLRPTCPETLTFIHRETP